MKCMASLALAATMMMTASMGQAQPLPAAPTRPSSAPSATQAAAASPIVARVNGAPIHQDLLDELARSRGLTAPPQGDERATLLEDLVMSELLAQKARAAGLDQRAGTVAELELQYKAALGQRLIQQLAREHRIDDAALRERYAQTPAEVELDTDHILLADEAQAKQAIARLNKGARFADLARQLSLDEASRAQGGRLGVLRAAELTPPYAEAARALKPGRYTRTPVQTEFGWHVIRLVSVKTHPKHSFELMRSALTQQMLSERVEAQVLRWRDEAQIKQVSAP